MKKCDFDFRAVDGRQRAESGSRFNGFTIIPMRIVGVIFALVTLEVMTSAHSSGAKAQSSISVATTDVSMQALSDAAPVEIIGGLNMPWSGVRIGEEVLLSRRGTGEILALRADSTLRSVGIVPDVVARGDGGMLGLASLTAGTDIWLYAYHGTASGNRIVRAPYSQGRIGAVQVVLDGVPGGPSHNGGRIAFGPDGMLYVTVGELRNPELSQNRSSLAGKILRMTPEGRVPDDNPFRDSFVYSFGHRNPQGLAWDREGRLWATEFGADSWDELNRIEPGENYGWPVNEGRGGNPAFKDPVLQWRTQEMGPSGLAFIDGTFFIAGLTGQRLWSVTIDASGSPVATAHYIGEYGRIRDVLEGPDGKLWFITNGKRGDGLGQVFSVPLRRIPAAPARSGTGIR